MGYFLILFPILFVSAWIRAIINDKSGMSLGAGRNVTEVDGFCFFFIVFSFCSILSIVFYFLKKKNKKLYLLAFTTNILAVLIFVFIDYFNLSIDYEKWLSRGMPGPSKGGRSAYHAIVPVLDGQPYPLTAFYAVTALPALRRVLARLN